MIVFFIAKLLFSSDICLQFPPFPLLCSDLWMSAGEDGCPLCCIKLLIHVPRLPWTVQSSEAGCCVCQPPPSLQGWLSYGLTAFGEWKNWDQLLRAPLSCFCTSPKTWKFFPFKSRKLFQLQSMLELLRCLEHILLLVDKSLHGSGGISLLFHQTSLLFSDCG